MEEIEIKTRIKDVMLEKNIPLVKLSELVGIEKGNLSAIVNDKRNPTLKTLLIIAKALEVDITELFVKPSKPTQPAPPENLPFGCGEPSAIGQQAIVCPHCHQALVFNIASYEQKK